MASAACPRVLLDGGVRFFWQHRRKGVMGRNVRYWRKADTRARLDPAENVILCGALERVMGLAAPDKTVRWTVLRGQRRELGRAAGGLAAVQQRPKYAAWELGVFFYSVQYLSCKTTYPCMLNPIKRYMLDVKLFLASTAHCPNGRQPFDISIWYVH